MMNFKSLLLVGAAISLLSGSEIKYTIQPHFNEDTKKLTIDTLVLENVSQVDKFGHYDPKIVEKLQRLKGSYLIDSPQCNKIRYSLMMADSRSYFKNNFELFLRNKSIKEGTSCDITKVANIRMHECNDSTRFYVSTSEGDPSYGFKKREYLMLDQQCFQTVKKHFTKKAEKDNVAIINTTIEQEPPFYFDWQLNENLTSQVSFSQAKKYCEDLTVDGKSDWRLPTKKEFSSTPEGYFNADEEEELMFWTSSMHHSSKDIIWMQSLPEYGSASGFYDQSDKKAYVKCVRDK